jgi:hypothetical protein
MYRLAQLLAAALLGGGNLLLAGCGGGLSTTTVEAPDAPPGGMRNDDPMARPIAVAWTSSRARRCGFVFDGAKLRTSYLAWEAKQGVTHEQMAKIEQSYDATYKIIFDKVAGDAGYCTDRKSAEIKTDLQRHLAGDYAAQFPPPKVVASCGFFGCSATPSDQPFSSTDFWKKQDANPKNNR